MIDEKAFNKIVAANLRRIMYEKGVTQTDMAKALGFTKQSVSHWMRGDHLPRMDKIDKICNFLGCRRSDLLEVDKTRKTVPMSSERAELIQLTMQASADNVHIVLELLKKLEGMT
jgi:transcriptional regulator with XRE-family HTH domain